MANVGYAGSADKTITVQEFIAIRTTDDVTYYNYSIVEYLHGFDMFITNLLMTMKMNYKKYLLLLL